MRAVIKLLHATALRDHVVRLAFSDGSRGDYDFAELVRGGGGGAEALKDPVFFRRLSVKAGTLAWPNGFELEGGDLRRRLAEKGLLRQPGAAG